VGSRLRGWSSNWVRSVRSVIAAPFWALGH
jgi:hypothetical protein